MKPKLMTCLKCGAARKYLFAYLDEVDVFRVYRCQKCGFIQHAPMCGPDVRLRKMPEAEASQETQTADSPRQGTRR